MRAVVYDHYGPPDVLRIEEVDQPVPKEDEVLVRIHATTVNRTDCGVRSAEIFLIRFVTGLRRPRQRILGSEIAGEVEGENDVVGVFEQIAVVSLQRLLALANRLRLPPDAPSDQTRPDDSHHHRRRQEEKRPKQVRELRLDG